MAHDHGERFSGKTADYSRSRPQYPQGIIDVLRDEKALGSGAVVADIGSGTGKLAELFLRNGFRAVCIEPNPEMRLQASVDLEIYPSHRIMEGTAEKTGLVGHSVDLVVAGQAFHWFDPEETRKEFMRILKPGGMVALIWNDRIESSNDFNSDYESICRTYSNGYHQSGSLALDRKTIDSFFGGKVKVFTLENAQELDLEGVKGRYFSASYALKPNDTRYGEMLQAMSDAFSRHSHDGHVNIRYETKLFLGIPHKWE